MSAKSHYQDFAAYNQWANQRVYDVVSRLPVEVYKCDRGMFFNSFEGTLNHLVITDLMWLYRMTGEGDYPQKLDEIIYDDFEGLREARVKLDQRIIEYASGLEADDFGRVLSYMTVSYGAMESKLSETLAHFFNHQTHHRGQIHNCLSQIDIDPPPLDYMLFLREGSQ